MASCQEITFRALSQTVSIIPTFSKSRVLLVRPSLSLSFTFSASKVENMFKEQFKFGTGICAGISCLTVLIYHVENGFFNGLDIT